LIHQRAHIAIVAQEYLTVHMKPVMVIEKLPIIRQSHILTPYKMTLDHLFIISVKKFMYDIRHSITKVPDGYLEIVKQKRIFQDKFEKAIEQIYDPYN